MSTIRFDTWQNVGGTAEYYKCRAWVNFNGTGVIAIRAAGNVTSITDVATGNYLINFTTAMPDINYAVTAVCGTDVSATTAMATHIHMNPSGAARVAPTTTSCTIAVLTGNATAVGDSQDVAVAIFR